MPPGASRPLPYDAHVHTTNSDGRNSLVECVRAAEACGLQAVAITDHLTDPQQDISGWVKAIVQADAASDTVVVPGVEGVILDASGRVSVSREQARMVRWVLVDMAWRTKGVGDNPPATLDGVLANVEAAMCAAAANPVVDAIAHPLNMGRFQACLNPEDFPRDMLARIASAMAEARCAFEIMNQAYWWHPELSVSEYVEQMVPILQLFAEAGVNFVVGSDAHSAGAVGNLTFCQTLMKAAGIGRDMLIDLMALNEQRRHEQSRGARLA